MGSTRRRQSLTQENQRGEDREREEVVAEEREGKMRTEHFKLTQNSIVKDKSRGKRQLESSSPRELRCTQITALPGCLETKLASSTGSQ